MCTHTILNKIQYMSTELPHPAKPLIAIVFLPGVKTNGVRSLLKFPNICGQFHRHFTLITYSGPKHFLNLDVSEQYWK
jgi:hypothetical protein